MKVATIMSGIALPLFLTSATLAEVPEDAQSLLDQLLEYEKTLLEKSQRLIEEKRSAVAKALQPILERETKAGHLDNALDLRSEIGKLQSKETKSEVVEDSTEEADMPPANFRTFRTWLLSVAFETSDGEIYALEEGLKDLWMQKTGSLHGSLRYKVTEIIPSKREIHFRPNSPEVIVVAEGYKKAVLTYSNGNVAKLDITTERPDPWSEERATTAE